MKHQVSSSPTPNRPESTPRVLEASHLLTLRAFIMANPATKKTSSFESVFVATSASALEMVQCNVKFIRHMTFDDNKRAMLLVERNGVTSKVYCFAEVVEGLRAPFKAELLVEEKIASDKKVYWNVTAISAL